MVSRSATAIAIGTSLESPSARLDVPSAVTKRISSVAYAVEEMASDENTASAMTLGMRWCSCSAVASGRPTTRRLNIVSTARNDRRVAGVARAGVAGDDGAVLHDGPCT